MNTRTILIALFAFGIGACTTATDKESLPTQSSMEKSIDAAFDDVYARYRLPGLALGVVRDGKVIYTRTAGSQQLFKIASNSKAMTTARRCSSARTRSRRGNFEIGRKPISNPKSEIANWTFHEAEMPSNSKFRISDLRCRIRPISQVLMRLIEV